MVDVLGLTSSNIAVNAPVEPVTEERVKRVDAVLSDLLAFADARFPPPRVARDDAFGVMAVAYLAKQMTHVRSMRALGHSYDSGLIARSMLEGLCQLLWAAQDKETRALRWHHYVAVHDWRTLRTFDEIGRPVTEEDRKRINDDLANYGEQFLKKDKTLADAATGDPFVDGWHKPQVRQVFEQVGALKLYQVNYSSFSDWHHWNPGGVMKPMIPTPKGFAYKPNSLEMFHIAKLTAFHVVHDTVEVSMHHFEMPDHTELAALAKRLLTV